MKILPDLDPARVVVAGDWHRSSNTPFQVVNEASRDPRIGAIVHVGDFAYQLDHKGVAWLTELHQALDAANLRLIWVDGNHDDHAVLDKWTAAGNVSSDGFVFHPKSPTIGYAPRSHRWTWNGHTWCALGGANSVDRQIRLTMKWFWSLGERFTDAEVAQVIAAGPADVLVAHQVPDGVPLHLMSRIRAMTNFGWSGEDLDKSEQDRATLGRVVDALEPELVFGGHYHQRLSALRPLPDGARVSQVEVLAAEGALRPNTLVVDTGDLSLSPLV
jgi:hypothetical protein